MKLLKIGSVVTFLLIICTVAIYAGTTPPSSVVSLTGTAGQDGWFRSNIDVSMTITDTQSGPAQTTYWVDSNPPTVVNHDVSPINNFNNPSFESGSFWGVTDWDAGFTEWALYYTSRISPHNEKKSIAIAALGSGEFFHWTNENYSVEFPEGVDIRISAFVRAVLFDWNRAYYEVWAQDASGNNDTLLGSSADFYGVTWPWEEAIVDVTIPSGTNYLYVKLGGEINPGGIVYWDDLSVTSLGSGEAVIDFNQTTEGNHSLHYFSVDNNGNVESARTTALKVDTVIPNPWQDFSTENTGCNHCYTNEVQVRDATSGVDVSTGEYRFYTEHLGWYWSDWATVDSVKVSSNGQTALDGETDFVTLTTPEVDFGDSSSGPFRLQFRIYDMAGNLGTSPVYEILAPWLQASGGSVYLGGEISLASPPVGFSNSNADTIAGQTVESIVNSSGWSESSYLRGEVGISTLNQFYSRYGEIKSLAVALPTGKLPTVNGTYINNGSYTIDVQALPAGFESADVSSIVIIEGDLTITKDFVPGTNNFTVFFVEGDVFIDKNVEKIGGVYVIDGQFHSDASGKSTKKLTVYGTLITLDGYSFSRDLGDNGPVNNLTDPAEQIVWQPGFLFDPDIITLLTGNNDQYIWQEVE